MDCRRHSGGGRRARTANDDLEEEQEQSNNARSAAPAAAAAATTRLTSWLTSDPYRRRAQRCRSLRLVLPEVPSRQAIVDRVLAAWRPPLTSASLEGGTSSATNAANWSGGAARNQTQGNRNPRPPPPPPPPSLFDSELLLRATMGAIGDARASELDARDVAGAALRALASPMARVAVEWRGEGDEENEGEEEEGERRRFRCRRRGGPAPLAAAGSLPEALRARGSTLRSLSLSAEHYESPLPDWVSSLTELTQLRVRGALVPPPVPPPPPQPLRGAAHGGGGDGNANDDDDDDNGNNNGTLAAFLLPPPRPPPPAFFPLHLLALSKLSVLVLDRPGTLVIPPVIGELPSLRRLEVRRARAVSFHGAAFRRGAYSGSSLTRLALTDCNLTAVPPVAAACLPQLRELDLSGNRGLSTLPALLGAGSRGLRLLRASRCDFARLPPVLTRLSALTRIDFSANPRMQVGASASGSTTRYSASAIGIEQLTTAATTATAQQAAAARRGGGGLRRGAAAATAAVAQVPPPPREQALHPRPPPPPPPPPPIPAAAHAPVLTATLAAAAAAAAAAVAPAAAPQPPRAAAPAAPPPLTASIATPQSATRREVTLAQLLVALPALEVLDLRMTPSENAAVAAAGCGGGEGDDGEEDDDDNSDDDDDGGGDRDEDYRAVLRTRRRRRRRYAAWPEWDESEEPVGLSSVEEGEEARPCSPRPSSSPPPPLSRPSPPSSHLRRLRYHGHQRPKRWSAASLAQLRLVGADVPLPRQQQQQGAAEALTGFAGVASLARGRGGGGGAAATAAAAAATAETATASERPGGPAWKGRLLLPPFAGNYSSPAAAGTAKERARVTGKRPAAGALAAAAGARR